eukprot:6736904-Ditylum_brightwellii.AAC.1
MFETKEKEDDPSSPSTPMTPNSNGTDYTPPTWSTNRRENLFLQNRVSAVIGRYRIGREPDPCDLPHTPEPDEINIYLNDDGIVLLSSMEEILAHPLNAKYFLKSSSIQMKKDLSIMKWYHDLTTHAFMNNIYVVPTRDVIKHRYMGKHWNMAHPTSEQTCCCNKMNNLIMKLLCTKPMFPEDGGELHQHIRDIVKNSTTGYFALYSILCVVDPPALSDK